VNLLETYYITFGKTRKHSRKLLEQLALDIGNEQYYIVDYKVGYISTDFNICSN
jgi:hypothetical protein